MARYRLDRAGEVTPGVCEEHTIGCGSFDLLPLKGGGRQLSFYGGRVGKIWLDGQDIGLVKGTDPQLHPLL